MFLNYFVALFVIKLNVICISCDEPVQFLTKIQTSSLEKYEGYVNAAILYVNIPEDIQFASFRFYADQRDLSFLGKGCSVQNVSFYMKYGSAPVINPDGSRFPTAFRNITRPPIYHIEFLTDKQEQYVNLTSPEPGFYYIATFLSYSDPRFNKIEQDGIGQHCFPFVDLTVFTRKPKGKLIQIVNDQNVDVKAAINEKKIYKIFIPEYTNHIILKMEGINFTENATTLITRVQANTIPSAKSSIKTENFYSNITTADILIWTEENKWHYVEFVFTSKNDNNINNSEELCSLRFKVTFISNSLPDEIDDLFSNDTSQLKIYRTNKLTEIVPYKEYNLFRESSSDSFVFTYELESEINSLFPVAINITNSHFITLKFYINAGSDVGGTLQYILAFKPRIDKARKLKQEPEDHRVVGCIRPDNIEIPTFPNQCSFNGIKTESPLILNKTLDNSTVLIPYPKGGYWYATFKLFCGKCEPCECSSMCQNLYETCIIHCELDCKTDVNCTSCAPKCSREVFLRNECRNCDCDGPCKKNNDNVCNSSILFDISSQPCVYGDCSKNGRCMFLVSHGFVYSSCVCSNNYRGWDCSDNSQATPFGMVVLELCLLVLSNLAFLPAVVIAYRRKYYVESITYFASCFFSTFYHACDAGENIISYCLTRLSALQFGDFFCALLAMWVTLLAVADLPGIWPPICQMLGAIILSFCTNVDRRSLWIFILPTASGISLIILSWYLKYRKLRRKFVDRNYLKFFVPPSVLLIVVGLVIYSVLQTAINYKYLHSLWHMLMAAALVLLLPKQSTFLPDTLI